jgi:hypothetical protein
MNTPPPKAKDGRLYLALLVILSRIPNCLIRGDK